MTLALLLAVIIAFKLYVIALCSGRSIRCLIGWHGRNEDFHVGDIKSDHYITATYVVRCERCGEVTWSDLVYDTWQRANK